MNSENELAVEVGAIHAGIRRLDADIESRKSEIARLERTLADLKVLENKLRPIVEGLKSQREGLISQCKEYEEKIEALRAEYRKLRAPLDAIPT